MRASVRKGREVTLSFAVAKRKPEKKNKINKKNTFVWDSNLWPLRYQCSAPTERRYFAMIIGKADTPTNEDIL